MVGNQTLLVSRSSLEALGIGSYSPKAFRGLGPDPAGSPSHAFLCKMLQAASRGVTASCNRNLGTEVELRGGTLEYNTRGKGSVIGSARPADPAIAANVMR